MEKEEEKTTLTTPANAPTVEKKKDERLGPKNLCKKYRISRDDYYAVIERITRWILDNYNFGSEIVTVSFLDLIRNGDIQEEITTEKKEGIYRRENPQK